MEEGLSLGGEMAQPGKWLVEIIPMLRFVPAWMPGAGFKRRAAWARERLFGLDRIPFNWAKEQIVRPFRSITRVWFPQLLCFVVARNWEIILNRSRRWAFFRKVVKW
jgi:hypothetical protein